jgi:hypothetical protein
MRQGPHHSAQKSTTTGSADYRTSDSKLASDTLPTAMVHLMSEIGARSRAMKLRVTEPKNAVLKRQGGVTRR